MTLDEILDKLEGVKPSGSGWIALCPAHEDSSPSLSIHEGDTGPVLHCQAGCTWQSVFKALGMEGKRDRWDAARAEATYDYVDEAGRLLFQVLRMPGKEFPSRHKDGDGNWKWGIEGVRRVLYGLPQVIAGVGEGKWVVITEGEKDVEAIRSKGGDMVATCNPGGAGKWRPEYAQVFTGARVIVWADKDEPGRNHAETIRKSLIGVASEIHLVQSKVGKDAHDHLIGANLTMQDIELAENQFLVQRGIITSAALASRARDALEMTADDLPGFVLVPGVNVTWRQGRFYAIGGYTGDGKTTFVLQGVRSLASHGKKGGVFSLEMPERDLRNRLIAHRGIPLDLLEEPWRLRAERPDLLPVYESAVTEIGSWEGMDIIFDTQVTSERIEEITREREYDWVVIDHIHRFGWGNDRRSFEAQVMKLTNLAIETNTMVIVLCQLRRWSRGKDFDSYPQPTLQDFRETEMIGQDSSMALSVWRRRDQQGLKYLPGGATVVSILKNRHVTSKSNATGHEFWLNFDEATGLYAAGAPAPTEEAPPAPVEEEAPNEWYDTPGV